VKYFYDSGLSEYFPAKIADLYANLYWFGIDIILLLLIPVLIIIFYFRENIKDYGLRSGDINTGLKVSWTVILFMAVLLWFISASGEFSQSYPSLKSARDISLQFLVYELALFIYIIAWEFIWRGYMLFGLEKKFGYYAVFIQMIPFVLMHSGKPFIEMLGAIPGGIFLGILALRTRSIFYGVIIHFFVMLLIDFFSILRIKSDDFGTGFDSLINIFSHLF
jgi:membrane protease YdiL (CAAX protease family)